MMKSVKLLVKHLHLITQYWNLKICKEHLDPDSPDSILDSSSDSEWLSQADKIIEDKIKQYKICHGK